ncbi:MAG: zinc-binding dehydrogenase, partial [Spirochaetota bacterium]
IAAGDIMFRKGVAPINLNKFVPGFDIVGRVEDAGSGDLKQYLRKRVLGLVMTGGYSEYVYANEEQLVIIPDDVDPVKTVSLGLNYTTALGILSFIREGALFFQGLSGGLGTALLDITKNYSIDVWGSTSEKTISFVESYGAKTFDYNDSKMVDTLKIEKPEGFDLVVDPFGGKRKKNVKQLVKKNGKLIGIGYSGDSTIEYLLNRFSYSLANSVDRYRNYTFFSVVEMQVRKPNWIRKQMETAVKMYLSNQLDPVIADTFKWKDAGKAHARLAGGGVVGKLVLTM